MSTALKRRKRTESDLKQLKALLSDGKWYSILDISEELNLASVHRIAYLTRLLDVERKKIWKFQQAVTFYRLKQHNKEGFGT